MGPTVKLALRAINSWAQTVDSAQWVMQASYTLVKSWRSDSQATRFPGARAKYYIHVLVSLRAKHYIHGVGICNILISIYIYRHI